MTDLRYHNSSTAEASPSFTHAVADGLYVFLSGQIALDSKAPDAERGTIEGETRTSLNSLVTVLRDLGLDFADVVKVNIHMKDLSQFERMDRVYQTFVVKGKAPARTTVGAGDLLLGSLIEIDCIARMR